MSKRSDQSAWNVVLGALGITAAGLYFGLHRFLWRLWLLSGLWVLLLVLLGSAEGMRTSTGALMIEEPFYWVLILGPPVLLLVVAKLLDWIISG
jgi:hypothetical protein